MWRGSALLMLSVAATACSAQPAPNAPDAGWPPQPAEASRPVPRDAPLDPAVKNVPATAGRANLPATAPPFALRQAGAFDEPFAMAFLPDGDLLVTEKAGALKLRRADGAVVEIGGVPQVAAGGQGGLLDVAVAPDFATSRAIYLSYAEPGAAGSALALMRARLAGTKLTDAAVVWRSGSNGPGGQFGAKILFSPDGRYLYLSSGERQRFMPAQDPGQLLGKILRLTLDGKAAPGNPQFAAGGARAMTWSTGHRNPYGLAFLPDGTLWEAEMGPRGGDELNRIEPGRNYGWPLVSNGDNYSGQTIPDHPSRPEFAAPALWWNPSISPTDLLLYTGEALPALKGSLLLGAMSTPGVAQIAIERGVPRAVAFWDVNGMRIRDLAQAPDGTLWLLEDGAKGGGGRLFRAVAR